MADRDHPPEFVAAEAWRVIVKSGKPWADKQRPQENPAAPASAGEDAGTDFWKAAWNAK